MRILRSTARVRQEILSGSRIWQGLLWMVAAVVLLAGCGQQRNSAETQTVTLAMGFIPNIQFAPFYVAVEKGYFADEGIEITFDYGWETDLLKLVGSGELQFAIASGDQVVLARSQELPVIYILNWYRRFPVCVMSLPEAGITTPADLRGKQVGTPVTYGASYIGWRALLSEAGIAETEVELVSIGYTQVAAVSEGQVDAAVCYAMNEPVQMRVAGDEVDVIYVSDYINLVSNGLITNDRTIRDSPGLVEGMVRAALRGLAYTIENPDEAFEISREYVPEMGNDEASLRVNRAILEDSIAFWSAPSGELGRSNRA
ncbi:MAG TPA: ABC transporter substrate-binding protein, partial [Anaerolineae bacterium]|nr:ABC transporter substrate-binding protein [Anaerolineae bacterium]